MKAFKSTEEALSFLKEEEDKQAARKTAYAEDNVRQRRFYMKYDTEALVLYLDDLLFPVVEHSFKDSNGWTVFETCIEDIEGECPLCDNKTTKYLGFASTIIHINPYDKKGNLQPPTKKLIVIKQGASKNWLRRQKEYGTLKGKIFNLYRSNDSKSATTGSDMEFKKNADWDRVAEKTPNGIKFEDWIAPYDYKDIFKPKTPSELRKILAIPDPVGSEKTRAEQQDANTENKKKLADLI